jgi:hypothetical protein
MVSVDMEFGNIKCMIISSLPLADEKQDDWKVMGYSDWNTIIRLTKTCVTMAIPNA